MSSKLMTFIPCLLTLRKKKKKKKEVNLVYNPIEYSRRVSRVNIFKIQMIFVVERNFLLLPLWLFNFLLLFCFSRGEGQIMIIFSVLNCISCLDSSSPWDSRAFIWQLALITFIDFSGLEPRLDYFNVSVLKQCKTQHIIMLGKLSATFNSTHLC